MRVTANGEMVVRRARGYAPQPLLLPSAAPRSILACGAELKSTFCLVAGRQRIDQRSTRFGKPLAHTLQNLSRMTRETAESFFDCF